MEKSLFEEEEIRKQEILKKGDFVRVEIVVERNGYTDPIVTFIANNVTNYDVASLVVGLKHIEKKIYERDPIVKATVKELETRIESITEYEREK